MDRPQKRKQRADSDDAADGVDTSKPTATFKRPKKGRSYTVSVALPGSIVANAQTHDQKTTLAGTIARALSVFCVDEIVIFDDGHVPPSRHQENRDSQKTAHAERDKESGYTAFSDPSNFLYHVLSYLETPPHLRRALFPHHPNLRTAGSLNSLDMPHHTKPADTDCLYREGVTTVSGPFDGTKSSSATYANIGASAPVQISDLPEKIQPNVRLTLKLPPGYLQDIDAGKQVEATAVAPDEPREEEGYYWGYSVRVASCLSDIFEECTFDEGYDYCIGTSERGSSLKELLERARVSEEELIPSIEYDEVGQQNDSRQSIPGWRHLLIAFGGVAGLEQAFRHDTKLRANGVMHVSAVFDEWINLVDGQGSRTIRTEEAIWIGLMGLKEVIDANGETG